MIDWEKYNRSQAAISGLGFVEVDIKDYEEMRAALQQRDWLAVKVETLRAYGNKDCTAMADEVLASLERKE